MYSQRGVIRGFYIRSDMIRSEIEQDELDCKIDSRGPGRGREGSEGAAAVVQEREDEAWFRAVRVQRGFSVTTAVHAGPQSLLPRSVSVLLNAPHN